MVSHPEFLRSGGKSGGGLRSPRLETFAAKHRPALCWTEGNRCLLAAAGAGGLRLDLGVAVILSGHGSGAQHSDPLVLACLTTFRFVLELLIVEEKLFPGRENKISPTVDTLQHLVLKFH